jgi:hypothetical protein
MSENKSIKNPLIYFEGTSNMISYTVRETGDPNKNIINNDSI